MQISCKLSSRAEIATTAAALRKRRVRLTHQLSWKALRYDDQPSPFSFYVRRNEKDPVNMRLVATWNNFVKPLSPFVTLPGLETSTSIKYAFLFVYMLPRDELGSMKIGWLATKSSE